MRSPSTSCLKSILLPYTITICVLSFLLIVFCALIFAFTKDSPDFGKFEPNLTNLIVGGSVICVTNFLACFGALHENPWILITCAVLQSIFGFIHVIWLIFFSAVQSGINIHRDLDGDYILTIVKLIRGSLGGVLTVEIIGVVLLSLMASAIRTKRGRIQTRESF